MFGHASYGQRLAAEREPGRQVRDTPQIVAQPPIPLRRDTRLELIVPRRNRDQPLRLFNGERPKDHGVHHRKRDGADRHTNGQDQDDED